ncbi:MAG: sugar ABC transporter ATP-binding protein [Oscillospiraceae bacterium]|nr:sugar ABC transporter ATP-binding protein [Oscillospiraceae bacterium]
MQDLILEMKHITKDFSGNKALDDVTFEVRRGEIHGLVGENGAGKSTLMNVLSGIWPEGEYSGQFFVEGQECKFKNIQQSEQAGIAIIHQELALIPLLSIAENIFMGHIQGKHGVMDWNLTYKNAIPLMERVGLHEDPQTPVGTLGVGKQQLIEIAKALSKNCKILILDEPTAALNERDSKHLLDLLKTLQADGITCIIISHKLGEICYVADSITVLRDGKTVADFPDAKSVTENELVRHMVGREMSNRYPEKHHAPEEAVSFEIRDWCVHHPEYPDKMVIKHANIKLRKGEVVGLAGLMGAGRTELAMSVFGKSYGCHISGEVYKDGEKIDTSTVSKAIQNGIAYLSEDRKQYGLILDQTISKNISLANLRRITRGGVMDLNKEIKETGENAKRFGVKCATIFQNAGSLSGGNQQKVVLAKWMFNRPDVLLLDEPTRGIDVGAKYDIYCIINELAAEGKCVLVISSELPELLGICDRIYVMNEGEIRCDVPAAEATQESLMHQLI